MNSEGHLILYSFSRITIVGPSLEFSPTLGSWIDLQYKAWVSSCGAGLKSSDWLPPYIHAIIVPMGISCHPGHYCTHSRIRLYWWYFLQQCTWHPLAKKLFVRFSPPSACFLFLSYLYNHLSILHVFPNIKRPNWNLILELLRRLWGSLSLYFNHPI